LSSYYFGEWSVLEGCDCQPEAVESPRRLVDTKAGLGVWQSLV
jgi:hypothetical protein